MTRRLASIGIFALIAIPFLVIALLTIMWWAAHWLRTGEDDERILLNPLLCWLTDLP